MKHWAYRATTSRVSFKETLALAELGFVCRSAFTTGDVTKTIGYVKHIEPGDVLHMHYRDGDKTLEIGAYVICERDGHPLCDKIEDDIVERTGAIYVVGDASFLEPHNLNGGYEPDPVLKQFTGWLVRPVTCNLVSYDPAHFNEYGLAIGKIPEDLWPHVAP